MLHKTTPRGHSGLRLYHFNPPIKQLTPRSINLDTLAQEVGIDNLISYPDGSEGPDHLIVIGESFIGTLTKCSVTDDPYCSPSISRLCDWACLRRLLAKANLSLCFSCLFWVPYPGALVKGLYRADAIRH